MHARGCCLEGRLHHSRSVPQTHRPLCGLPQHPHGMEAAPLTIAPRQRARPERVCRLLSPVSLVGSRSDTAASTYAGHVPANDAACRAAGGGATTALQLRRPTSPGSAGAGAPRSGPARCASARGTSPADSAGGSSRPVGPTPPPKMHRLRGRGWMHPLLATRWRRRLELQLHTPPPCTLSLWHGAGRGPPEHLRGSPAARAATLVAGRRATRRSRLDSRAA